MFVHEYVYVACCMNVNGMLCDVCVCVCVHECVCANVDGVCCVNWFTRVFDLLCEVWWCMNTCTWRVA